MPVSLQQFFNSANAVGDSASLFLQNGGESVGDTSSLHGIHKLSRSAKAEENRATVTAFLNALDQSPQFRNINADMRGMLNAKLEGGKPLTAEDVKLVRDSVLYDEALAAGRQLVDGNALPAGHATSFAQFALVRNLDLGSPQGQRDAVQTYLCEKVIPQNVGVLTQLPGLGTRGAAMSTALTRLNQPLTGANGFFAGQLRADMEARGTEGAFTRLQTAFRDANAADVDILSSLKDDMLGLLPQLPNGKDMIATLKEALPTLGRDNMQGLAMSFATNMPTLATPAERQDAVRGFMMRTAGKAEGIRQAMTLAGLPQNFSSALANNPAVIKHCTALLNDNPGPGVYPSQERVAEAMDIAVQVFVEDNLPLLREFAIMAQDPPGDLNPPVTAETMPRYINAMLAGDVMVEQLLNDSVPMDAAFLERIADHADALNSAAHSFKGDYGADDIAAVLRNSVSMLLARRGVTQDMLPDLMKNAVDKFGPLANQFATLNGAIQRGLGGMRGLEFLKEGMTQFRSLEGHARALISLMSREQKVDMGIATPGDVDPQSEEIQRQDGELLSGFLESKFEVFGDTEQIPVMLREFARSHGLDIPRLSTTQRNALSGANRETFNAVLDELIPEQGHVVEANTDAFRAVFDSINEDGALAGLRPEAINPRPFYQSVSQALTTLLNAANEEGNAVDAAQLRQLAGDIIGAELLGLKDTLDDIGALPAERFSDADKDVMKEIAQRYGVRDAGAIAEAFTAAKELPVPTGLVNLARLDQTPGRFTQAVMDVSERFCAFHERYAQLPGSEDLLPMMCDFILEGMTPDELANVSANMQSDMAHTLAGACLHIVGHPGAPRDTAPLMGATQIMNNLRQNAEYRLGHNPQVDPMYFNDEINHLCEMPGDAESPLSRLGRFAPGVITDFDVQMNRHAERLTPQQWEQLRGIHTQLAQTAQGAQGFLLPYWVESSASDLLAALEANRGKPLSNRQIWDAMVGGPMPRGISAEHFGADLIKSVSKMYVGLLQAAAPDMPQPVMDAALMNSSSFGLSPKKLIALTRPHAHISLNDISVATGMGSLSGIDEETAYGLVTDFRRRGKNTVMQFEDRSGNGFATSPFSISDEENTSENPHFTEIIDRVRDMTHSEGQLARVIQCFSQAPLIMPRVLSTCFPGVEFSEHGNFSVSAKEQQDGSVLVDITSDPSLPLILDMQIRVGTDGSHTFERLDMSRP